MVLLHVEEEEPNGEQRSTEACWNPKRHISLVSLLLCRKIAAVRCFVWRLGLQMWSGSEAVTNFAVFT